jgi:hypothetical protein
MNETISININKLKESIKALKEAQKNAKNDYEREFYQSQLYWLIGILNKDILV